jgi:alkylation response protein AidB-like acyl-CoA dehydrogenase
MDFDLTEEQQLLKSNARAFLEKEIAPQVEEYESRGPLTRAETIAFIKQLMPLGYYNGQLSEEYGGSNLDVKTHGVLIEEFARVWAGLCGTIWIAGGAGGGIPEHERVELQQRVRAGESIACAGITEPEVGSGSTRIETRATLDGDEWVVNGTKTWISCAPIADHARVTVTVDPAQGGKGLRTIWMRRDASPWEHVRHNNLFGLRTWPNGEMRFDNVRVPRTHMAEMRSGRGQSGDERSNGERRVWSFERPRAVLAIMSVGIAQAAIDASIRYAQERQQFGRPIGSFQLVQEMLVDMVIETESARFLAYRAMDLQDKGRDSTWQASAAKAFATEMAIRVASKAIEIHGALGLLEGYPIERYFRDARSMTIPDGTTEIQKLVIGRQLTGISAFN